MVANRISSQEDGTNCIISIQDSNANRARESDPLFIPDEYNSSGISVFAVLDRLSLPPSHSVRVIKRDDKSYVMSITYPARYRRSRSGKTRVGEGRPIANLSSSISETIINSARLLGESHAAMAPVSRERASGNLPTRDLSNIAVPGVIGYRLRRGACSRTSSTYAREILHATEMARPTINYGGTWYSIHGPVRGDPVRIRKPLHATVIDPDRINRRVQLRERRERERGRERVLGAVAFIHGTIGAFTYVHVRKSNPVTPRCITPPAGSRMKSDIIFQCTFDYVRNKTRRKFLILYSQKSEIIRGIYQAKPHCVFQTECGYVYLASSYYIDIKKKNVVFNCCSLVLLFHAFPNCVIFTSELRFVH